jgi:hypothetical protein
MKVSITKDEIRTAFGLPYSCEVEVQEQTCNSAPLKNFNLKLVPIIERIVMAVDYQRGPYMSIPSYTYSKVLAIKDLRSSFPSNDLQNSSLIGLADGKNFVEAVEAMLGISD